MKKLASFWDRIPIPLQVVILILASPIVFALAILAIALAFFLLHTAILDATRSPSPSPLTSIGEPRCVVSAEAAGWQYSEKYQKYVYDSADFTDDSFYRPVTESDMRSVQNTIESYYKSLRIICAPENEPLREKDPYYRDHFKIYEQFDFFPECVTPDDYICQYERRGGCEFYYFDSETLSLYYFYLD